MSIRAGAAVLAAALFLGTAVRAASADSPSGAAWGDRLYGAEDAEPPSLVVEPVQAFEDSGLWGVRIDSGEAATTLRGFAAAGSASGTRSALGLKLEFLSRTKPSAYLFASRPIALGGTCSMLSLEVLGRGYPHSLYLVVLDYFGRSYELPMGKLDFRGWKRLSAYVPRFDPFSGGGIVQDDPHYERPAGLRLAGLRLDFDPEDSYGSYYVYFRKLEAMVERPGGTLPPAASGSSAEAPATGEAKAADDRQIAASSPMSAEAAAPLVLAELSRRIADSLSYPDAARRRGAEGTVLVAFAMDASGALTSAQVARSSGSDILDRAALELLGRCFPVENKARARLSLRISIEYSLSAAKP